jgi:hypothetical protein
MAYYHHIPKIEKRIFLARVAIVLDRTPLGRAIVLKAFDLGADLDLRKLKKTLPIMRKVEKEEG